jgi:hypothetical protein
LLAYLAGRDLVATGWSVARQVASGVANGATRGSCIPLPRTQRRLPEWIVATQLAIGVANGVIAAVS